jgi:hypothetical protein
METPETKHFYSEYDFSWQYYVLRAVSVMFVMRALYYLSRTLLDDFPGLGTAYFIIEILVDAGAVVWMLTSLHIEEIEVSYSRQKVVVAYVSFFRRTLVEIPFDNLNFTFATEEWSLETIRLRGMPKQTLTVFDRGKKVFALKTNDHGFSATTLSDLNACLQEIK